MRSWLVCIFFIAAAAREAAGCKCAPIQQTPCDAAENAAFVFRGRLVEAIPIPQPSSEPGIPPPPPSGMRYRFQVLEDFSGAGRTTVELIRRVMTDCDREYNVGTEYLVYARRNPFGKSNSGELHPGSQCDRTRPVAEAQGDLQQLRHGCRVSPQN